MCISRKLVAVNKLMLGARELGWEVFSLPKGEVLEFTSKQLRDIIKGGKDEVYGLKIAENGIDLAFDEETFFTKNMMHKVHVGSLTPMVEDECMVNLFYIVIGTHVEKGETRYDVVSSRYERTSFTEEKIKTLLEMGVISGGAKLQDNKVIVAPLEKAKPVEKAKPAEKKEAVKAAAVMKEADAKK